MKKIMKRFFATIIAVTFGLCGQVFAATAQTTKKVTVDPIAKEYISKFPEFEKSLDKYTNGKLAYSQDVYLKVTPKSTYDPKKNYNNATDIKKDFESKTYTKEEYENEMLKERQNTVSASGIGPQEGGTSSWLNISLQVYYGTTLANYYMAYNFGTWLTKPYFTYTDAMGISLSSELVASGDSTTRTAVYNYKDVFSNSIYETRPVQINSTGNGVMAQFQLYSFSTTNRYVSPYNNTMISTGVKYSNTGSRCGWITANYLHKELSFGSISMNINGVPSVSYTVANDMVQGNVYVSR